MEGRSFLRQNYLCIYFPAWSIELFRKSSSANGDNVPILLVSQVAQQSVVQRCCTASYAAGVRRGMPLALAHAIGPHARVAPYNPFHDLRSLLKLAGWCVRFTPLVGIEREVREAARARALPHLSPLFYGIIFDLRGTERLYGEGRELAERLRATFARHKLSANIAIAPTIGAGWALSRYGSAAVSISTAETVWEDIKDLPVAALRISSEIVATLTLLGIETIEALRALPRKKLALRFGIETLERLDSALGLIPEQYHVVRTPQALCERREFEVPLQRHESIRIALLRMVRKLIQQLRRRKRRAASFVIILEGKNDAREPLRVVREVALVTASSDSSTLLNVLQPLIERLHFPGGVDSIVLTARSAERVHEQQRELPGGAGETPELREAAAELCNHLALRLGRNQVRTLRFHSSHIPERSFSYENFEGKHAAAPSPQFVAIASSRPSFLLPYPERIAATALLPDKPPSQFNWRGVLFKVIGAAGPERISHEWWHQSLGGGEAPSDEERDYFKVQDHHGRWLWLFRKQITREWYVQGLWI